MKWLSSWSACLLAMSLGTAQAMSPMRKSMPIPPPRRDLPASTNGINVDYFQQVLDHSNPSLGKFQQRFWWDKTYWKGPGSPVVMLNVGEVNATGYQGYCLNDTITGLIAQKIGAATIVIEHRYWGESSPFDDLSTKNMQYLTLQNNIADMTYFANNVNLPFSKKTNAKDVPWILVGGSYPGALTAYIAAKAPGTFWAYLATSAPVQTISNYWQYFQPVQQGMAKNCSTDVSKVINYMDGVMTKGSKKEIHKLKSMFGMSAVEHNDDFMAALENGPWLWQSNGELEISGFFEFCDYVENSVNKTTNLPGADGVGLTKALSGYADWFKNIYLPDSCSGYGYAAFQGADNLACYNTYNASSPFYTDTSLSNTIDRQWNWILCNQPFGFWQDGAPKGQPTLVSRLSDVKYWTRQCGLFFPPGPNGETYGIAKGLTPADVDAYTGGWNIDNTTRLIYTNGQYDPWRSGSVSSEFRPGGPLASTEQVPVNVIPDGVHCYDLITAYGDANPGVAAVQQKEVEQMAKWVAEWPGNSGYHG